MFNTNLILNVASKLNLSLITSGDLNKIIKTLDGFKPKNNNLFFLNIGPAVTTNL